MRNATVGLDRQALIVIGALDGHTQSMDILRDVRSTLDWPAITPRVLRLRPDAERALSALQRGEPVPHPAAPATADGVKLVRADAMQPRAARWLWPGRIPLGVPSLLVGEPGLGKTQLAILIAAQASRGLLGDAPADVLIASGEDAPEYVLLPRLLAVNADLRRVHFVQVHRDGLAAQLTLPDDVDELAGRATKVQARLIVLDPVMAHLGAAVDAHRDHSIRRALAPIYMAAERLNAAVICVAHLNKGQSVDVFRRVGGSIGLTAAARSILLMTRDPEREQDDKARVLVHAKSNLSAIAPTLRLTVEGCEVEDATGRTLATSRVVLGEDAPHLRTADVLATQANADGDSRTARDSAEEWLRSALAEGERNARDVLRDAERERIAKRTLERAKARLGVNVRRVGFGPESKFVWSLPHCPPPGTAAYGAGGQGGQWERPTAATDNGTHVSIDRHTHSMAPNAPNNDTADLLLEGD